MIGNYFCVDCTCNKTGNNKRFTSEIDNEDEKVYCPNNSNLELKLLGTKTFTSINTGKFKKGRPKHEREKRRTDDFRKEVLPYIPNWEKKHFEKKLGKPL